MKNKLVNIFICICIVISMLSINVFASSGTGEVTVPKKGISIVAKRNITRSRNCSYVLVSVRAVTPIPPYNVDTYSKCKAALYIPENKDFKNPTLISDWYTITEGKAATQIKLKEGRLMVQKFNLNFKGNNTHCAAVINYSYNGL